MSAFQAFIMSIIVTMLIVFGPNAYAERWPQSHLGGLSYMQACEKAGGYWPGLVGCLRRDAVIRLSDLKP